MQGLFEFLTVHFDAEMRCLDLIAPPSRAPCPYLASLATAVYDRVRMAFLWRMIARYVSRYQSRQLLAAHKVVLFCPPSLNFL
jgi:hypothetical protein